MRQLFRVMKPWVMLLAVGLTTVIPANGEAGSARFSQLLPAADRTAAGIDRLSSDQLGALDALVRRDTAAQGATRRPDPPLPARFSQRLTEDERRNAGCPVLTEAELTKLDALVERQESASLARTLLASPMFVTRSTRLSSRETVTKTAAEVHGEFSLSYGVGKGGYSEKSGSMVLRYEDPARNLSITFGYAETHTKSPFGYRDGDTGPWARDYPGSPSPFFP